MNATNRPSFSSPRLATLRASGLSLLTVLALASGLVGCKSTSSEAGESPAVAAESGAEAEGVAAVGGEAEAVGGEAEAVDPAVAAEAPSAELAQAGEAAAAPAGECTGVRPTAIHQAASAGTPPECATCLGSTAPDWVLEDFQTQSCGFGSIYGLDQFRGKVTLVVLLSAGCGYCLGQAEKLEELWWELKAAGHDVAFAVINQASSEGQQAALLERTSFPMFQSTSDVNGWEIHDGAKDDFYIYDTAGVLRAMYPAHTEISTSLGTPEGYGNVRDAVLNILGEPVALPGNGVSTGVAPGHEGHGH